MSTSPLPPIRTLPFLCDVTPCHTHPLFELDIKPFFILAVDCWATSFVLHCFRRCRHVHCLDVAEYAHVDDAHIVSLQTGTTADQHWPLSVALLHATGSHCRHVCTLHHCMRAVVTRLRLVFGFLGSLSFLGWFVGSNVDSQLGKSLLRVM